MKYFHLILCFIGKFYLEDVGFPFKGTLPIPYKSIHYHLKEYFVRCPQDPKEIFNHQLASLQIDIEKTFGVLKIRFPILASGIQQNYSL